jgi:hypothetical protein
LGLRVTGDQTKLHSDELHYLYSLQNIIRVINQRGSWAGQVERTGEIKMRTKFWSENLKGRDCQGETDACGRMMLNWSQRNGV